MNTEIWRSVASLEHSHEVSSLGRLRTVARDVEYYHGTYGTMVVRKLRSKPVTLRKDKDGYIMANLSLEKSKTLTVKVHRLVAQAFIANTYDKPQVNHIDGDKTNNRVENLEWVTNYENRIHALETGLHASGSRSPHAMMTEAQILVIKERIAAGDRNVDIAKDFGVSHKYISGIRHSHSWSRLSA